MLYFVTNVFPAVSTTLALFICTECLTTLRRWGKQFFIWRRWIGNIWDHSALVSVDSFHRTIDICVGKWSICYFFLPEPCLLADIKCHVVNLVLICSGNWVPNVSHERFISVLSDSVISWLIFFPYHVCVLYTWITLFNLFIFVIFAYHMLQMMLNGSPILFSHWVIGNVYLALFLSFRKLIPKDTHREFEFSLI